MNDLLSILAVSALSCTGAIASILTVRKSMTRQFGAQVAYAMWALVPLASMATLLPARSVVRVVKAIPASGQIAASPLGDLGALASPVSQFDRSIDVAMGLCGLWILGMAASMLVFRLQHRRFVRGLGRLDAMPGDVHRAQTTQGCPALVGVWHPRIVLPADFESRYSASERELILAHERHHLARGDALANALATVLRSVFWFNPLVHLAMTRFMADQELACDAAVIARFPSARRVYADAMLKAQASDFRAALACHWTPRNLLAERIARLAHPPIGRSRRWIGNTTAVAMIVSGSIAAWASQPIETRTQYESWSPIETSIVDASDASHAPTPVPDLAKSEAPSERISPMAPHNPSRKDAAVSRDVNLQNIAARPQRNSMQRSADPAPAESARTTNDASAEPASVMAATPSDDRSPRELASYRRDHAPKYPAAAARAHIEGTVVLDVGVDASGNPTDARVENLLPATASELASASLAAVTHWQFEPALHNGHAVAGRLAVPFVFALSGLDAYAAPETRRQASYRTVGAGDYPDDLAGAEGIVYVRVRIENDGAVSSSEIDRVDPPSATSLGASALASLRTWTFNPARERGKAIASTAIVPIVFGANARPQPDVARIRNSLDPIRVTPKRT